MQRSLDTRLAVNSWYMFQNFEHLKHRQTCWLKGEVPTWGVFSGQKVLAVVKRNALVLTNLLQF